MDSVRGWAEAQGYDYQCLGDELFEEVPAWFRVKAASILPATDLGRLLWARRLLRQDYERVVWLDADLLVFRPNHFSVDNPAPVAFTREINVSLRSGRAELTVAVNNSVCMFRRAGSFLPFYIDACYTRARAERDGLHFASMGTLFLTDLWKVVPFPLIKTVGCFDGPMVKELINGGSRCLGPLIRSNKERFCAANLCHSFTLRPQNDPQYVPEAVLDATARLLLDTEGAVLDEHPR